MSCSQKDCQRLGLFRCDACFEDRCANHAKICDECGRMYCYSFDAMCHSAHLCVPPAKKPATIAEQAAAVVDARMRVNR
jgi:hypothetical protein